MQTILSRYFDHSDLTSPRAYSMASFDHPFTVSTPTGNTLACILSSTQHAKPVPPANVLVLCHGFTASKSVPLMRSLSTALLARLPDGSAVARFDFSGNGESSGTFRFGNYAAEAADLRAVILHVHSLGFSVNAIAGHSKAATVVLMYAATHGDVPTIVNLAGRFAMREGLTARFGEEGMAAMQEGKALAQTLSLDDGEGRRRELSFEICWDDLSERWNMDMNVVLEAIPAATKVLTVHGTDDKVIPVHDGREIMNRLRGGRLVTLTGAGHNFRGFENAVADEMVQFLNI